MVLYISISYQVIGIVCLDQLKGAPHSHMIKNQNVHTKRATNKTGSVSYYDLRSSKKWGRLKHHNYDDSECRV